jgi:hypothetical protein
MGTSSRRIHHRCLPEILQHGQTSLSNDDPRPNHHHVASVAVIWSLGKVVRVILDVAKKAVKDTMEEATQFRHPFLFLKRKRSVITGAP